mgnify:CR=1 FL=1
MVNLICLKQNKVTAAVKQLLDIVGLEFCTVECFNAEGIRSYILSSSADTLIIVGELSIIKTVLRDAYELKYVINEQLKQKAGYYASHSSLKTQFNIDDYILPNGFKPIFSEGNNKSFFGEVNNKRIFCFSDSCAFDASYLLDNFSLFKTDLSSFCFKLFGIKINDIIDHLKEINCPDFYYKVYDRGAGDVALFLYFNKVISSATIDNVLKIVYSIFGEYIYADFDTSLCEVLVHLAMLAGIKIATTESLTGGMLSSKIIEVPNVSKVLDFSLVTYSNQAKQDFLGVSQKDLSTAGAVSEIVAKQMAEGLLKNKMCDLAIATTGLAGPGGASAKKPIGLVYTAIATNERTHVFKSFFEGDRNEIRNQTVNFALFNTIKVIKIL